MAQAGVAAAAEKMQQQYWHGSHTPSGVPLQARRGQRRQAVAHRAAQLRASRRRCEDANRPTVPQAWARGGHTTLSN